jgi:hypothetical protein
MLSLDSSAICLNSANDIFAIIYPPFYVLGMVTGGKASALFAPINPSKIRFPLQCSKTAMFYQPASTICAHPSPVLLRLVNLSPSNIANQSAGNAH